MLENISDYIQNICFFIIISTVIFNLYPNNKNISYIKMFSGFLLVMIIIKPITDALSVNINLTNVVDDYIKGDENERLQDEIDNYSEIIMERINGE